MSSLRLRDRRSWLLQAGAIAPLGLSLPSLLHAQQRPTTSNAKSCILLFATGGPAQQETFDPKPEADIAVRGEFTDISTSVAGIRICEHLPLMARQAHHYAIVRSTYHDSSLHGAGVHYNLTGQEPAPRTGGEPQVSRRDPPCIGGALRQLRGDHKSGLPNAIHLPVRIGDENNFRWGGQHAGYLGERYDPLTLIDESWLPGELPPDYVPNANVGVERRSSRLGLLDQIQSGSSTNRWSDGFQRAQEQARSVLSSHSAWQAFRLDDEKPSTRERYGDNKFGRSCLVARRLVEAGVGLVTVPWMYLVSTKNFDTHKQHFRVMKELLLPPMDRAFSALLEDLAQRGMLNETLVAWTGEFGRTPKINKNAGRDHWADVYSTVLAGGGIQGGQTYGASDKSGGVPSENPVHASDFVATIYHALGYGPRTTVKDTTGRPHPVMVGNPVLELF